MPFTLAHPAAVLPLRRLFVLPALVVGSMSPDFEYFLRWRNSTGVGHTVLGVFWYCLPLSVLALWLYYAWMKDALIALAPARYRSRLAAATSEFRFAPAGRFALILASIVVGAFTHLLWDAFTHDNGWVVQRVPLLWLDLFRIRGHHILLFRLLQYGGTVVGLAALSLALVRWYRGAEPAREPPLPKASPVAAGALLVGPALFAAAYAFGELIRIRLSHELFVRYVVIAYLSALTVGLVFYGVIVNARRKRATP